MSKAGRDELRMALSDLERELQMLDLWSIRSPTSAELASIQPFCVDTMAFEQWLQWIFIPRMRALDDQGLPPPAGCHITPMGDQSLQHLGRRRNDLLVILGRIDRLARNLG